jgi:hypothetical protein
VHVSQGIYSSLTTPKERHLLVSHSAVVLPIFCQSCSHIFQCLQRPHIARHLSLFASTRVYQGKASASGTIPSSVLVGKVQPDAIFPLPLRVFLQRNTAAQQQTRPPTRKSLVQPSRRTCQRLFAEIPRCKVSGTRPIRLMVSSTGVLEGSHIFRFATTRPDTSRYCASRTGTCSTARPYPTLVVLDPASRRHVVDGFFMDLVALKGPKRNLTSFEVTSCGSAPCTICWKHCPADFLLTARKLTHMVAAQHRIPAVTSATPQSP